MNTSRLARLPGLLAAIALPLTSHVASAFDLDRWLPIDVPLMQWWQLYASVPTNVRDDYRVDNVSSADICGLGQNGPLWFLVSTAEFGANTLNVQRCTVPKGKLLMVPIIVSMCIRSPGDSAQDNVQYCRELTDPFDKLSLTIDGVNRNRLIDRHAHSLPFPVSFPTQNLFEATPGAYQAVAEGYYAIVDLPVGKHLLKARAASKSDPNLYFAVNFEVDVVAPSAIVQ
jgi:hypothetical protein